MRKNPSSNKMFGVYILALLLIIAVFIGRGKNTKISPSKNSPNIVVIVMDTTRQDHLACYGYTRNTSPNLNKLSESSRTYYNAYSTSGWTAPAHASLFTGLFPMAHKTTQENWKMGENLITLAEILSVNGYETIGITENPVLSKSNGFDQGFLRYYETWQFSEDPGGENIAFVLFQKNLKERDLKKPFFLFINFIEPHSPYNSSRQFYSRFVTDLSITYEDAMMANYFLGKIAFTPNEIRHLIELYDAEILYVDYLIGKIVDDLKQNDLWDNMVFIVTSDHGENFGEHGMMAHVFSLHESIIKVPLMVNYPRLFPPNTKNYHPVQLTDIFPTVLKISGVETGKYPCQGSDLFEKELEQKKVVFSEYYYPKQALEAFNETDRENRLLKKYKRRIKSVISDHMKLIWGSDGNHELYDIGRDPRENENLINDQKYSSEKRQMLNLLLEEMNRYDIAATEQTVVDKAEADKTTREALKSLGYLQ